MSMIPVAFWDLNFFKTEDEGWLLDAYPYDDSDEPINNHNCWINIPLTSLEKSQLRLGHVGNRYSSDDDFWIGLEYFLNDYHNQSDTVREKLSRLPEFVHSDVSGRIHTIDGNCEHLNIKHVDSSAHLAFCVDCNFEFNCECEEASHV